MKINLCMFEGVSFLFMELFLLYLNFGNRIHFCARFYCSLLIKDFFIILLNWDWIGRLFLIFLLYFSNNLFKFGLLYLIIVLFVKI